MEQLTLKLSELVRPDRNIRIHTEKQLKEFERSVQMFGRNSRKRKENEGGQKEKDYKQELIHLFNNMDVFFDTPHKRKNAERYRNFFMQVATVATNEDYKHIYEGLISGDPKGRAYRALYHRVYGKYIDNAKKMEDQKHG